MAISTGRNETTMALCNGELHHILIIVTQVPVYAEAACPLYNVHDNLHTCSILIA